MEPTNPAHDSANFAMAPASLALYPWLPWATPRTG